MCKSGPLLADKHTCQKRVIAEVKERYDNLPYVGVHDMRDEALGSLFLLITIRASKPLTELTSRGNS